MFEQMDETALARWLHTNASPEEIYAGAAYVGRGRGNNGVDWHVHDRAALVRALTEETGSWTP